MLMHSLEHKDLSSLTAKSISAYCWTLRLERKGGLIMQIAAAVLSILIVLSYAGLSGFWVESNSGWYNSLKKPFWQPPNFVFGIIWPYNFFVLAIAGVQVSLNSDLLHSGLWLLTLSVSVGFAIAWSWDFYKNRKLARSALWLSMCALVTIGLMVQLSQIYPSMFWWLFPYQLWLVVAASLAAGYAQMNPK